MALDAIQKEAFRRGLADEAAYDELVAIIDTGTQPNTLSVNAKIVLKNALAHDRELADVIAALESGTALSDEAKEALRRLMGYDPEDSLVTEIGAIA